MIHKDSQAFAETIGNAYSFKGKSFKLGGAMLDGQVVEGCAIRVPLGMMNRHGLISGATGTGKTKTLQLIAEGLSDAGVPVLLMDIKGDLSGLAAPGALNEKIRERYRMLFESYQPSAYPVELLSLSGEKGVRLKATAMEFGPVLLAKVLGLNDTQEGLMAMLFKYCDDHALPLLDLRDLIKLLQYAGAEGKSVIEQEYGKISTVSLATILRKIIGLQQQGGDRFFGELSFEVGDLMRSSKEGKGMINILRVTDMQDRPALFSAFMLQLLAEMYAGLPESGDRDQPGLVIFIDEAHLLFKEASDALLQEIETIVKLIRSKGVGVFFCTQNPMDVPESVLGQLGMKVQHALRAFTAKDRAMIRKTAENYPLSDFYKTDELLTQLGIGEALVTMLDERGIPTPLAHTFMMTPRSRMDILTGTEIDRLVEQSELVPKYNREIDRESAFERLNKRMAQYTAESGQDKERQKTGHGGKSWLEKAMSSSAGRQVQRSLVRTLFGVLQKMLR